MTPRVRFDLGFPDTLKSEVSDLLTPFLPLVKMEIENIQVAMKGSETDVEGEAATLVLRRYHTAHLWLDPAFWKLEQEDRVKTILHELMHIFVDIFAREFKHLVDHFVPEDVKEYVSWKLEDVEERLTDSLALAFAHIYLEKVQANDAIREAFTEVLEG